MSTPIRLKRSAVSGKRPLIGDIQLGELALNFYDGKLYAKQQREGILSIVEIGNLLSRLEVTGISTFVGLIDANGGAEIDNIRIGVASDNEIDTSVGNLTIDSAGGTTTIDDRLIITGISTFNQSLTINSFLDVDGNLNVDGTSEFRDIIIGYNSALIDNIQIGITQNNKIDTNDGILLLGSSYGTVRVEDRLEVTGITTVYNHFEVLGDNARINNVQIGGLIDSTLITTVAGPLTIDSNSGKTTILDELVVTGISTFSLGVDISNIRIGLDQPGTINTDSGDLTLDSQSNLVIVDSNLSVLGNSNFTGNLNLTGISTIVGGLYVDNLYFDGTSITSFGTNLSLTSGGPRIDVNSDLYLGDNLLLLTDGTSRLEINSSGGQSFIRDTGGGNLVFTSNGSQIDFYISDKKSLELISDGGSKLYYNGNLNLEIYSDGIKLVPEPESDTSIIAGPSNIIIDPSAVGDNTGTVRIKGDLYVDGTQTIINSSVVTIDDLNLVLADGAADDLEADGAGIIISSGDGNKKFEFQSVGDNFGSTENLNLGVGKVYKINNVEFLSETHLTVPNFNVVGTGTVGILTATNAIYGYFDGELNKLGKTYYVSENGSDSNTGDNINQPFRSLSRALNSSTVGDAIYISPGTFEEECPLVVPGSVTIKGSGLRTTTIKPTEATKTKDIFKLSNASTVEDITISGSFYDPINDSGYAFSYQPGMVIESRSPYIQRVTVLNRGSNVTASDPYGYDSADAGRGAKIDGSLVAPNSLEAGMLFNEVTFFTPNQKGIILTNGARVEYLNCFHYFASEGIVGVAGTVGFAGVANAKIRVAGLSTTPVASDIIKLYSGGVGIATGTVVSHDSGLVTISGLGEGTFTSVGAGTTQDIRVFSSDGVTQVGTADTITFADYKMFGAEIRSVSCAFEYGDKGVVADGNGVLLRLFAANFNHIGSGKDFTNDDTLVIQSNEVTELNGGKVSYVSIDQKGDFRVGETFLIDQETGNVSFAATSNMEVLGAINIVTGAGQTMTITDDSITTTDNLTINTQEGTVTIDDQLIVSGIATFQDRVIFDSTNSIQIPVGVTSDRDPIGVAVTGQIRYNKEYSTFEGFGPGNAWGSLGGVKDVDGNTYIIPESSPGANENILYFYNNGYNSATLSENLVEFNTDANITGVVTATSFYGEGGALTLGGQYVPDDAPTDGDYVTGGALNTFTENTKIVDSIDELNELAFNIIKNTAVTNVDFVSTPQVGGSPLNVSLNITYSGNANRYDVDWGDGTTSLNQSVSTIAHTYTQPNGAILPITVTARNNTGVGAGHSQTILKTNYITVYTPDPDVNFAFYAATTGGSPLSYWDSESSVYLQNTTTNVTGFAVTYTINYGDGSFDQIASNAVPGGVGGGRTSHVFTNSSETDTIYTVTTTLNSHPAADPAKIPALETQTFKVYSTHTPSFTNTTLVGINSLSNGGFPIVFTNTTENTIGSYTSFGNTYLWTWGDGSTNSVNVGSGSSGDTGNTISHTFSLSTQQQVSGITSTFNANLRVNSNHTSSPFITTSVTISVEPEVRSIFTGVATVRSDRTGDDAQDLYAGIDLFGRDRSVGIFTNTSHNGDDYVYAWGDGTSNDVIPDNVSAGGTSTPIYHSFQGSAGNKTVTLTANGTPGTLLQTGKTSTVTMQLNAVPSAPTAITAVNLSMATGSEGTSPYLCALATRNQYGVGVVTGTSVTRYSTVTDAITNYLSDINGSHTGTLSAQLNGVGIGTQTFTTSTGESGTFGNLHISSEGDAHDEISASTYPTGFYQTFTARVTKPLSQISVGVNDYRLVHSTLGSCGLVTFVKDDLNTTPTLTAGTLTESSGGIKRYISGIPYYDSGGPTLSLSSVQITNFTGQTYQNTSTPVNIDPGTNYESTSGNVISTRNYTYAQVDGSTTFIDSTYNVPFANTGVGSSYTFGSLSIPLTSSSIRSVQDLKIRARNSAGTGSYTTNSTKVQVHTASQSGISEISIGVASTLGNGTYTDNGKRIFDLSAATTNTPTFNSSTNFYTNNVYSEASDPGVQGTKEATIRLGVLKYDITNYSTGYLPVGPNRSGDTGTQYFTFAFRRQVVANFDLNITSSTGVAGVWIAAPGTQIDTTSGLNGWLRADTTYAGSGIPGSSTGGNGSDGCASNSGDRILPSTALSGGYTMTLGSENMSNATNNVVLVRIALTSGQSITSLSVGVAN